MIPPTSKCNTDLNAQELATHPSPGPTFSGCHVPLAANNKVPNGTLQKEDFPRMMVLQLDAITSIEASENM